MTRDHIYAAAKAELEELEARCREIEAFLVLYERYERSTSRDVPDAVVSPTPITPETKIATTAEIMSAVHDILMTRGDALTLSALFDGLCRRGIRVGGNNPKQNLSQKLSADDRLMSYGKRGWFFADQTPPSARPYARPQERVQNEKDPDDEVAGPTQIDGSEAEMWQSTSVPSWRDESGVAFVSSAPQHAEWET